MEDTLATVAIWGDVVSWIIVLLGWFVVNGQQNKRETRKEVRASLLDLYRHLDGIEDDSLRYHTADQPDALLARKIKRDIDQISPRIRLTLRGPMKKSEYARHVAFFRRAITLNNFDTVQFKKKAPSDDFFEEIMLSKRDLINQLEGAFTRSYR